MFLCRSPPTHPLLLTREFCSRSPSLSLLVNRFSFMLVFSSIAMVGSDLFCVKSCTNLFKKSTVTVGPPLFSLANTTIVPPEQPFVVAVVDLDAPTPQNASLAQIRHFLGGNYFISETTGELHNQSAALSEFLQPSPPNGSDPHR